MAVLYMKSEAEMLAEAQQQVLKEDFAQQIRAGKGTKLQEQVFLKSFPKPVDYTSNPIARCEYENPGFLCAFDATNTPKAFLPRTICDPKGIEYVKKDRAMWYKINTRWFIPLYVGLGLGILFGALWVFLDPSFGWILLLASIGICTGIAYIILLLYYWRGYQSFRTSPFKVRDEFECSKVENIRKYIGTASRFSPPQDVAAPINSQTFKVSTPLLASRYDFNLVGNVNNTLLNYHDSGLLQAQSSFNIDFAKTGIKTVLKDLQLLILQQGLEGVQVGVGQQPIQASTIAVGQAISKELPLGGRYLSMLESYKNPNNNKITEQQVQPTQQF